MSGKKSMRTQPNLLLRKNRELQGWTQQEVADRIGAPHPFMVNRWENGVAFPSPVYRKKLAALFGQTVAELGLLPAPSKRADVAVSPADALPLWHVPYLRNPYFTGREKILEHVHTRLCGEQALPRSCAVYGLGGVGKTQVALEYAYRFRQWYTAVFWIDAETSETLTASFRGSADYLQLPERQNADQQRVVTAVQHWLSMHKEWLLIWDNLEEHELFQRFLSSTHQGAILITTRNPALGTLALPLEVPPLLPEEGKWLLRRRTHLLPLTAPAEPINQDAGQLSAEEMAAEQLAVLLGGLPLALDQAGAYIEETGCGLADYLQRYEQQRALLLDRRGLARGEHPHSVTATFRMLWQRIIQGHSVAANLLRMCAFLHAEAIPEELFVEESSHLGEYLAADAYQLDLAVAALRSFSLVQRHPDTHTFSLHRLVQAVLQEEMSGQERAAWQRSALHALNLHFPAETSAQWKLGDRFLAHVQACVTVTPDQEGGQELAEVLRKAADYLRKGAQYAQAEAWYQRALHLWEQVSDLPHPELARALDGLALLFYEQGRYEQAEPLYQRAVSVLEQTLGPEHPNLARPLNNLAILYFARAQYEQAEPLYQRALALREQVLGLEHLDLARPLNNLALLYKKQGKYEQAEPLFQRALVIREQTLGPQHPDLGHPLNNLANLYREQGKHAQAEPLYQRALSIWELAMGPMHPLVARALDGLALLFSEQDKYEQAEPLYQRAVSILEQALGPQHADLAHPLNNLADLYKKQGKHEQAEPLFQQALALREQALGSDHPDVGSSLNGLAALYCEQCRYEEAKQLYQRALVILERSLGQDHPDTVQTVYGLAWLAAQRERYPQAGF